MLSLVFALSLFSQTATALDIEAYRPTYLAMIADAKASNSQKLNQHVSKNPVDLAFSGVNEAIFGSSNEVQLQIVESLGSSAQYLVDTRTVLLSTDVIKSISEHFSEDDIALYSFIIAHEISHGLLTNFCKNSKDNKTPAGNICSSSYEESNGGVANKNYFEHAVAYSKEHLEIDYMAYLVLEQMKISVRPVVAFLAQSPIPYGPSKRITDVLQQERLERIDQAKAFQ